MLRIRVKLNRAHWLIASAITKFNPRMLALLSSLQLVELLNFNRPRPAFDLTRQKLCALVNQDLIPVTRLLSFLANRLEPLFTRDIAIHLADPADPVVSAKPKG